MKKSKKAATLGILTALAFGLSYLELLIPFESLGIPGIKLGLANLAVMAALWLCGAPAALAVSLTRMLLLFGLFGSPVSLLYSLAGGLLSLGVMIALRRIRFFGTVGISIAGGVCHNIGQLAVAAFLTDTAVIFYELPILLAAGVLTGALNGFLLGMILRCAGRKKPDNLSHFGSDK